jgi:hypothetical protein
VELPVWPYVLAKLQLLNGTLQLLCKGNPPSEIREELNEIHRQVLLREALTRRSGKASTPRTATGKTLVKETIDKYTANIPVDIGELLKALGLTLDIEPLDSARGIIERNLRRGGFSGYRVAVNEAYSQEDQRVASAHELSHFLKDRNRFTDRLVDNRMYSSGLANHVEEEADKIALTGWYRESN